VLCRDVRDGTPLYEIPVGTKVRYVGTVEVMRGGERERRGRVLILEGRHAGEAVLVHPWAVLGPNRRKMSGGR
jgi:hypothetical protein